jgi:hypothetical protein
MLFNKNNLGSRLSVMNAVAAQEGLRRLLNINQRSTIGANKALRKIKSPLGVIEQKLTQHTGVVHLESNTC